MHCRPMRQLVVYKLQSKGKLKAELFGGESRPNRPMAVAIQSCWGLVLRQAEQPLYKMYRPRLTSLQFEHNPMPSEYCYNMRKATLC